MENTLEKWQRTILLSIVIIYGGWVSWSTLLGFPDKVKIYEVFQKGAIDLLFFILYYLVVFYYALWKIFGTLDF